MNCDVLAPGYYPLKVTNEGHLGTVRPGLWRRVIARIRHHLQTKFTQHQTRTHRFFGVHVCISQALVLVLLSQNSLSCPNQVLIKLKNPIYRSKGIKKQWIPTTQHSTFQKKNRRGKMSRWSYISTPFLIGI